VIVRLEVAVGPAHTRPLLSRYYRLGLNKYFFVGNILFTAANAILATSLTQQ
jgi:hypothetical protein